MSAEGVSQLLLLKLLLLKFNAGGCWKFVTAFFSDKMEVCQKGGGVSQKEATFALCRAFLICCCYIYIYTYCFLQLSPQTSPRYIPQLLNHATATFANVLDAFRFASVISMFVVAWIYDLCVLVVVYCFPLGLSRPFEFLLKPCMDSGAFSCFNRSTSLISFSS